MFISAISHYDSLISLKPYRRLQLELILYSQSKSSAGNTTRSHLCTVDSTVWLEAIQEILKKNMFIIKHKYCNILRSRWERA